MQRWRGGANETFLRIWTGSSVMGALASAAFLGCLPVTVSIGLAPAAASVADSLASTGAGGMLESAMVVVI